LEADDQQQEESVEKQLPNFAYMTTSALVMEEEGDLVDLASSTDELNRIANEGWTLITVDQGIAYWCMDVTALANTTEYEEETCGVCANRNGNLCVETGFSVNASDTPYSDGCFKPLG